jgi:hypothetical protein
VLVNGRPYTGGPIPNNSTVDDTNGSLLLKTSTGSLRVYGAGVTAIFKLVRSRYKGKPIYELRLRGGNFNVCKRRTSSAAQTTPTTVRRLWGKGKGSFRTRGRYSSATVRGTTWLTADRCDGTLVRVFQGVIEVRDFRLKKTVRVPRGKSYVAKAP